MRISDWSSDVCSSDLTVAGRDILGLAFGHRREAPDGQAARFVSLGEEIPIALVVPEQSRRLAEHRIGDVVRGHRIAVEVDAHLSRRERRVGRSEEHTSELQSLMRISYAVFCLQKKNSTVSSLLHITHTI